MGEPTSSVTTESDGRVRAAATILTGKFTPPGPKTHAVRAMMASGILLLDRELAGELGGAVDRQRVGVVGLGVGALLAAVEDEVGGDVDERQPLLARLAREQRGAVRVDEVGELGVRPRRPRRWCRRRR